MRKGKTDIKWNESAFEQILNSPEIVAAERRAGEKFASNVKSIASSAPFRERTGGYEKSIRIETRRGPTRTAVYVIADTPYAIKVERLYGILGHALTATRID